jgi:predicted secreted protein
MAGANAGRNTALTWNGGALLGVRTKSMAANGNAIDITSGEDAGKRLLLAAAVAQDEVNLSLQGVAKDLVLRNAWFAGGANRQKTIVMTWADGSILSGTFQIINYTEGHPYNDAITYQVELQSSGAWSYTPGA